MSDAMQPDPESQQPAPGQPAPGQPAPGQPAPGQQSAATGGLDPKVGGLLSYLLFGWIGGLIMYLTQKHPEVRFHAAQSILTFGALTVISIGLNFLTVFGLGALALFGLLSTLIGLLSFVLWVFLSIKGYNLEHFKLPVVGDMAEQWAAK